MIHADLGDPDSSSWKPLQADLGLPWWRDHCTCGLQVGQYLGALACPFSWPAFWPADLLIQLPQSHKPFLLQICFSGWALIEICQLRLAVYWFLFFFFGKDTGFFFFFFPLSKHDFYCLISSTYSFFLISPPPILGFLSFHLNFYSHDRLTFILKAYWSAAPILLASLHCSIPFTVLPYFIPVNVAIYTTLYYSRNRNSLVWPS